MAIPVCEYLLDSTEDESLICFGDELLVNPEAEVERCVICYRIPLSPRYVAIPCKTHIVCMDCGDRLKNCPLCRRRTQALYRNLDLRKVNQSALLHCPFKLYGCEVTCEGSQWKHHIRECPYEFEAWKSTMRHHWLSVEQECFHSCLNFFAKKYQRIRTCFAFRRRQRRQQTSQGSPSSSRRSRASPQNPSPTHHRRVVNIML